MSSDNHESVRKATRAMEHPAYEILLQYADGQIADAKQAAGIKEHLSECPICLDEFLFISEDLLPELEKPVTAAELLRNKVRSLVRAFEERYRSAGELVPLFLLTPVSQPAPVIWRSVGPSERELACRIDLHKDPRYPFVTILDEDSSGSVTFLKSPELWLNVEVAKVARKLLLSISGGEHQLVAIYTSARVALPTAAGAAEFLEALQKGTITLLIASATVRL